jgi:hypothetical protein
MTRTARAAGERLAADASIDLGKVNLGVDTVLVRVQRA